MTKHTYPTNLLYRIVGIYDPEMNRLDKRITTIQMERNLNSIVAAISKHEEQLESTLILLRTNLTEIENDILNMRYKYNKTLRECGAVYDVTYERIRQIEKRAITKLQDKYEYLVQIIWPQNHILISTENPLSILINSQTNNIENINTLLTELGIVPYDSLNDKSSKEGHND